MRQGELGQGGGHRQHSEPQAEPAHGARRRHGERGGAPFGRQWALSRCAPGRLAAMGFPLSAGRHASRKGARSPAKGVTLAMARGLRDGDPFGDVAAGLCRRLRALEPSKAHFGFGRGMATSSRRRGPVSRQLGNVRAGTAMERGRFVRPTSRGPTGRPCLALRGERVEALGTDHVRLGNDRIVMRRDAE